MPNTESTRIDGVSIGGYRSFGTLQRIAPLSKVNLFIGPNNCGKSNILRFVHSHLSALMGDVRDTKPWAKLRRELDGHIGSNQYPLTAGIGIQFKSHRFQEIRDKTQNRRVIELFDQLLGQVEISFGTPLVWCERYSSDLGRSLKIQSADEDTKRKILLRFRDRTNEVQALWRLVKPGYQGGSFEGWIGDIIVELLAPQHPFLESVFIPAVRQITAEKTESESWCGSGIVDHLAQLQNPDHHEQQKKQLFHAIELLLQDVIGNDNATLEIPYGRKSITVHMDNKSLPLESLGTGIHELIILAAG